MNTEAIRTLRIRNVVEGGSETVATMGRVRGAYDDAGKSATASGAAADQFAKRQLSMAESSRRAAESLQNLAQQQEDFNKAAQGFKMSDDFWKLPGEGKESEGLTFFLRETIGGAEASGAALIRWGRVVAATGAVAAVSYGSYLALSGQIGVLGDYAKGAGDKLSTFVTWLGTLDGKTIAAIASVGALGAAFLVHHAQADEAANDNEKLSGSFNGITGASQSAGSGLLPSFVVPLTAAVGAVVAASAAIKVFVTDLAQMGVSAERAGLDLETFQQLKLIAAGGGVSGKDFSSGAEKMAMALNDAGRNANELSKLLDANNVKFKDENKLLIDNNKLFDIARDLIQRGANAQDKIKIAEMLGLSKEWVPVLDQGAKAFEDAKNEASSLGLVSADVIAKAKQFDDEWRKSSATLSLQVQAALSGLLPIMDSLISKAMEWADIVTQAVTDAANSPKAQELTQNAARSAAILETITDEDTLFDRTKKLEGARRALAGTLGPEIKDLIDYNIVLKQTIKTYDDFIVRYNAGNKAAGAANVPLPLSRPSGLGSNTIIPAKDLNESRDAWERYADQVAKSTAKMEADVKTVGLGVQAHQQLRVQLEGEAILEREGVADTEARRAKLEELAKQAGETALALEKAKVANDISRDRQLVLLDPINVEIANKLKGLYPDIATALNSAEAGQMRFTAALKDSRDLAADFAKTFVHDLENGKSATEALADSLKQLSTKLIDKAIDQIINQAATALNGALGGATQSSALIAGTTTAATILVGAGFDAGTELVAAATAAAEILGVGGATAGGTVAAGGAAAGTETAVGGVTGGAALAAGGAAAGTALWGPIALLAAAAAALGLSGIFGDDKKKKAEEEQAKAAKAWADSKAAADDWMIVMNGGSAGTIGPSISSALAQERQFAETAHAAHGGDAQQDPTVIALQNAFTAFADRTITEFQNRWQSAINQLNDGLGPDSPIAKGAKQILDIGDNLKGFLADTQLVVGSSAEITAMAQSATQAYALSLLQVPKPLSDIQTALLTLQGQASQLSGILVQLGMSATDAAAAIQSGVTTAITALRDKFNADVVNQLNAASGKQYINDVTDLIAKIHTMAVDADMLGADWHPIRALFENSAQSIIDGAKLTGQAFDDLIAQFPILADAVHAFTDTVVEDTQAIADKTQSLSDRLFATTIDTGTRAGALADFDRKTAIERATIALNFNSLLTQYDQATAAERLAIQAKFDAAALQRQQSAADRLFAALNDTSTLGGALAEFDRKAEQDRQTEIAAGGEAIVTLEQAQMIERFNIIADFNKKAIDATQQAADAQVQALQTASDYIQSFGNKIKTYLDGLSAGPQSNLSPGDRLAAAQSQFTTQLGIAGTAGSGQRDALDSITTYSQNLLDAAKAFYGSSTAYQTILASTTGSLGTLPSQLRPEDLIVNAVNAAATEITNMKTALSTAISTDNPTNIATALATYFNTLDTNTDGLLSQSELKAVLTDAQVAAIYQTLNTDNTGALTKLGLITTATQGVNTGTGTVITNTGTTVTNTGTNNTLTTATNTALATSNNALATSNNNLAQVITSLSSVIDNTSSATTQAQAAITSATALTNINSQVVSQNQLFNSLIAFFGATTGPNSVTATLPGVFTQSQGVTVTAQNRVQDALNKIVINTFAIANNTLQANSHNGVAAVGGVYASGGYISGPGSGTSDSIPIWASNGEGIITAAATAALGGRAAIDNLNAGRIPLLPLFSGANDNGSAAEIRALRAEVAELKTVLRQGFRDVAVTDANGAAMIGEKLDGIASVAGDTEARSRRNKAA